MRTLFATLLICLSAVATSMAKPVTYKLDPSHTQIRVVWNHFGFSNPGVNFTHVTGTLVYDTEHPMGSSVSVDIPLSALDTHVDKLDKYLKRPDFFNVARFPIAHFISTRVRPAGDGKLTVTGRLTVHGISKSVTLDVTINKVGTLPILNAPAAGFDASTTLKRSDFGIGAYAPMVSDAVKVDITVEAISAEWLTSPASR